MTEVHNTPVFICGALRSGTTMLRLMLDHHPRISNFGETDFLFEYPEGSGGKQDVTAFRESLSNDGLFETAGLTLPDQNEIDAFVIDLTEQMRVPGRKLTINIHRHFERIPDIFPDAKVVHLLRDPRDVARSSIGMGWNGNTYAGVNHWIASEKSMEIMRERFPDINVLTVRNEDLVRQPETVLTQICAFLGEPYDPAMLEYYKHSTYAAPDPSLVEQWRTKLSTEELGLVEGKVGEMMKVRGYELSGAPLIIPSARQERKLRLEDRWGRFRMTIERYGLFLTLISLVGRRLGLSRLQQFAAKRINEKHKQYLK